MPTPTFNGESIFGTQTREADSSVQSNAQMESVPGVDGYRNYALGTTSVTWVIDGRLTGVTLRALNNMIRRGQSYQDGFFYTFQHIDGTRYRNCELVSFRPQGPVQAGWAALNGTGPQVRAWSRRVTAVVRWATPGPSDGFGQWTR
jgi:hypothetical protein